ncbi:hypothetical protein [Microcoleus sp. BROC3]|uniref:hypothetical protein n=1 Tax=Microcoleus sp. BROC3 TaxID=3055323 RepID=UPI002FD5B534
MTDRCQLNLRLDGRRELLETIKEVAAAEGLSVNAWVVRTLEIAANSPATAPIAKSETTSATAPAIPDIEPVLDTLLDIKLDTLLAAKFAGIEERLGKLKA